MTALDTNWNNDRLRDLAATLPKAEDGEEAWLAWVAGARPYVRLTFGMHLEGFNEAADLPEPSGRILDVRRRRPAEVEAMRERSRQDRAAKLVHEIRRQRPQMLSFLRGVDAIASVEPASAGAPADDDLARVLRLLHRFPVVARQLRHRHDNRATLVIGDEHDVQDLLHALLLIDFEDVRPEDPAPSQGGSSSRVDFVLYAEQIVIEVKRARDRLRNAELTSQINDDAGRYQKHPVCRTLVCFVYDPDHLVRNPKGFETDHTRPEGPLNLITVVRPQ